MERSEIQAQLFEAKTHGVNPVVHAEIKVPGAKGTTLQEQATAIGGYSRPGNFHDELMLVVYPVLLDTEKRFFAEGPPTLVRSRPLKSSPVWRHPQHLQICQPSEGRIVRRRDILRKSGTWHRHIFGGVMSRMNGLETKEIIPELALLRDSEERTDPPSINLVQGAHQTVNGSHAVRNQTASKTF